MLDDDVARLERTRARVFSAGVDSAIAESERSQRELVDSYHAKMQSDSRGESQETEKFDERDNCGTREE
jgi:hypothetical protein